MLQKMNRKTKAPINVIDRKLKIIAINFNSYLIVVRGICNIWY